jgi:hypothetical protein
MRKGGKLIDMMKKKKVIVTLAFFHLFLIKKKEKIKKGENCTTCQEKKKISIHNHGFFSGLQVIFFGNTATRPENEN